LSGEVVPAAEGGHLIFRESQRIGNRSVPVAITAQLADLLFLFFIHEKTSSHFPLEAGGPF
jgi:hypothetical protein